MKVGELIEILEHPDKSLMLIKTLRACKPSHDIIYISESCRVVGVMGLDYKGKMTATNVQVGDESD